MRRAVGLEAPTRRHHTHYWCHNTRNLLADMTISSHQFDMLYSIGREATLCGQTLVLLVVAASYAHAGGTPCQGCQEKCFLRFPFLDHYFFPRSQRRKTPSRSGTEVVKTLSPLYFSF